MKVNVTEFGNEQQKAQDTELGRLKPTIIQTIAMYMKMFGIAKVQLNIVRNTGVSIVNELTWKAIDDINIAGLVKDMRPNILLYAIKPILADFGIHTIEITMNEEEITEQKKYWQYIINGDSLINSTNQIDKNKTSIDIDLAVHPINMDEDPTNSKV